jgi:hypothetical protein
MPWVVYVPSLLHFWWKLSYRCSTFTDVPTPFLLLMLVCNGVEFKKFFYVGLQTVQYRIKLFHYRIDPISDWRPSVRQIFFQYRTRQYRYRLSATKIFDVAPTYAFKFSYSCKYTYVFVFSIVPVSL